MITMFPYSVTPAPPAPTEVEWDGGGANDNWTTAENWTTDTAPVAGDSLVFAGSTRLSPSNNFASGTSFAGIKFKSGAGNFVVGLSGTLNLSGGGAAFNNDTSSGLMKISGAQNITFTAAPTFYTKTGASSEISDATIVNSGFDLTFDGGGTLLIEGWYPDISGTGGIIKNGSGSLHIHLGATTFTGNIVVNAGSFRFYGGSGDIDVKSGATLYGSGYCSDITIRSGATVNPGIDNLLPSSITLESGSTFEVPLDGDAGDSRITSGSITLTGVNLTVSSVINSTNGKIWYILGYGTTTGTFVGKAEASTFVVSGRTLRINYNVSGYITLTDVT